MIDFCILKTKNLFLIFVHSNILLPIGSLFYDKNRTSGGCFLNNGSKKRGYNMYKDKVSNLLNAIDQQNPVGTQLRGMCFDMVEKGLTSFVDYVNAVYSMETRISVARFHIEDTREYQNLVQELDSARRTAHEAAISYVQILDRMCDRMGIEPIYGGSQDRADIGDFCGHVVNEYFEGRDGRVIGRDELNQVIEEEMGFER
jgi:hypothetical protein